MHHLRLWADEQGESHLESVEVDFHPVVNYAAGLPAIGISDERPALSVHFLRVEPGFEGGWHPAPRRQFALMVSGQVECETSDGVSGALGPGDVALLEDTTGKGHVTRVVGLEPVVMMIGVLQ